MNANETRELLRALEQELQVLAARLRGQGAPSALDPGSLGLAEGDRGADLFDQVQATESLESHFASRDRIVGRLHRVSAALERVKDGSYGECAECAHPIPPARLRALPEATTCVACQERLERSGPRAGRPGVSGILAEIDATPERRAGRRAEAAEFRSAADLLETLRESAVPAPGEDEPAATRPGRTGVPRHAPAANHRSPAPRASRLATGRRKAAAPPPREPAHAVGGA